MARLPQVDVTPGAIICRPSTAGWVRVLAVRGLEPRLLCLSLIYRADGHGALLAVPGPLWSVFCAWGSSSKATCDLRGGGKSEAP